jgi:hypothetical protein
MNQLFAQRKKLVCEHRKKELMKNDLEQLKIKVKMSSVSAAKKGAK